MAKRKLNFSVYKYLPNIHARAMMKGEILIGTLSDFRKIEEKARGDKKEGDKTTTSLVKETLAFDKNTPIKDLPGNLSQIADFSGGGALIIEGGNNIIVKDNIEDLYVFCTSKKPSREVMEQFENADSCIEITDPEGFALAISSKLIDLKIAYDYCLQNECAYIGHELTEETANSGVFLKDKEYEYQQEHRFVFFPPIRYQGQVVEPERLPDGITFARYRRHELLQLPIKPFILKCPEIVKFCRWKQVH